MVFTTPDDKRNLTAYIDYLKKLTRNSAMTMQQANELAISRAVGRYYGFTDKYLDSLQF